MYEELKAEIKEIIEITKECPAELQQRCFEILLDNYLQKFKTTRSVQTVIAQNEDKVDESSIESNEVSTTTSDITENDFHVKVRKFFQLNNINVTDLNRIYYKENGQLLPYYESMHSTKMSECQIRLTLLTAFEEGFATGDFAVNGENVRKRCQELKCYDSPNFATNFKNNAALFDNWADKYDKNTDYILSVEGKKQLAQTLIKIIAEY
ncbi:hypothetical protein [Bacteroides congonensis]|uniref:hypothetical protein n=1 Tax=Bacteroides congonensis TaxID=1871006 RepID=UPI00321C39C7